jgi:hypothetical protein
MYLGDATDLFEGRQMIHYKALPNARTAVLLKLEDESFLWAENEYTFGILYKDLFLSLWTLDNFFMSKYLYKMQQTTDSNWGLIDKKICSVGKTLHKGISWLKTKRKRLYG